MALIPNSQKIQQLTEAVNQHDRLLIEQNADLKKQKDITFFFTVIVAVTLVGTLVGLGGVYINALGQSSKYQIDSNEIGELRRQAKDSQDKLGQYQIKIEMLKVKYPWIKVDN